jgi:oxygen-dependent protoporphyrinogen oxidase
MVDVVIVGGGIAGLATAFELHRRGVSFLLFEQDVRLGGVILSEPVDGYTVDAGPDSLLIQKPEGIALCEEIGLGERLVSTRPPRLAFVQREGRLHELPAGSVLGIPTAVVPFVRTRLFSWPGKLRMGIEPLVPARREDVDESIGSFVTRRFGREATLYLAEPLLAGIHAGDVDRLSLRALFPRFADAERRHGSLLRAFRRDRPSREAAAREGAFKSLPGGLSEMVNALVKRLPPPSLRVTRSATSVSGTGPFRVQAGTEAEVTRAVVFATPAYVTARLLRDRDPALASLCGEIRYSSTAIVALAFERQAISHPLNGSGFVVPRIERSPILAASWLSSKWAHRAPEGRALLRTFHGGARDPGAMLKSDAELVQLSLQALRPLLGIAGDPLFTRVYRWERANAQHEVGHLERVESIQQGLQRHPGVFVTGSGFRGVGIPDCVADGRATGRQVAEWLVRARPVD